MVRHSLVILLLGTTLAAAQAVAQAPAPTKEGEEGKVSNDDPARPLQMPPASTEVKEAFEDFDRFQRRGAWERAFKALYAIPEEQAGRFVDGADGFIVTVARKRRQVVAALSPAGQAAYRLFYDAEAKRLVDAAEGEAELANLERVYSAYFSTSVGDNATDRLGDLYFELGRFDRAAECWLAIVRERADSELEPALLLLKAALALQRAGRASQLRQVRAELVSRFGDENVKAGGETAPARELLRRWLGDGDQPRPPSSVEEVAQGSAERGKLDLGGVVEPLWQVRFAESVEAGIVPVELRQWESHTLSAAVPATVLAGSTLFVNYLGFVFAVDLPTGKMLWRNEPLHHLRLASMQDFTRMIDPTRYAIAAAGDYVCALGRNLKEPNMMAAYTLTCRRAEGGEAVWQSADLADYNQLDFNGPPLVAGGKLLIAAKTRVQPNNQQRLPQQFVLAIQPHDGRLLWKTELGTYRQGERYFFFSYQTEKDPQPRMAGRGGAIYIDTHLGVLARLDADTGSLDWGYAYRTDPYQSSYMRFFYDEPQETFAAAEPPLAAGESFLIKGMKSTRVSAIDPDALKVIWDRPVAKSSRLLGAGNGLAFLGGEEISALDLKTRALKWATRTAGGSLQGRALVRSDGLWQLTPRGIYEIDPDTGTVRRIFRGADLGSAGGDLLLGSDYLLAVSNRTITAYPRTPRKEIAAHE